MIFFAEMRYFGGYFFQISLVFKRELAVHYLYQQKRVRLLFTPSSSLIIDFMMRGRTRTRRPSAAGSESYPYRLLSGVDSREKELDLNVGRGRGPYYSLCEVRNRNVSLTPTKIAIAYACCSSWSAKHMKMYLFPSKRFVLEV